MGIYRKFRALALTAAAAVSVAAVPVWAADNVSSQRTGKPYETNDTLVLTPSTDWRVRYDYEQCRLEREFGEGNNLVHFWAERHGPSETVTLLIAGKPMTEFRPIRRNRRSVSDEMVSLEFGPSSEKIELEGYPGEFLLGHPGYYINYVEIADSDQKKQSEVEWLRVEDGHGAGVTLGTGKMDSAIKALDQCIDRLVSRWGLDPAVQASLSRKAAPANDAKEWINKRDLPMKPQSSYYPRHMLYRFIVGADGKPTECYIQSVFLQKTYAPKFCKQILENARFEPALDENGEPTASYYRSSYDVGRKLRGRAGPAPDAKVRD